MGAATTRVAYGGERARRIERASKERKRERTRKRERRLERDRSHCDAEEPIFWAAWRDAVRYGAMLRDYHNNRRYYSVGESSAGVEERERERKNGRAGDPGGGDGGGGGSRNGLARV